MDALEKIGVIVGIIFLFGIVTAYEEFIQKQFNRTILSVGKTVLFVLAEGIAIYAYVGLQDLSRDNLIVMIIVSLVILIGCAISNVSMFGYLHGIMVTLLQLTAAIVILGILFMVAAGSDKSQKSSKRGNTTTPPRNLR